jgi:hypothetical protein
MRERLLEDRQAAFAHLCGDIDALGGERRGNARSAVVDNTDAKLAASEPGADIRNGDRHFRIALLIQSADVVCWAELLYCGANSLKAIAGIHDALPELIVLEALLRSRMQNTGAATSIESASMHGVAKIDEGRDGALH